MADPTVSALTLKGTRYGQEPRFPLVERARAAHAAGITSIGADLDDLHGDITEVRDYVNVDEIEWVNVDKPVSGDILRIVENALRKTGANRVNVGVCGQAPIGTEIVAQRVAQLADAIHPVTVAVEPVAFGALPHVRQIQSVVRWAGRRNAGLLLDFWQATQDGMEWVAAPMDNSEIAEVQVCGVAMPIRGEYEDIFAGSQDRPHVRDSKVDVGGWLAMLRLWGYEGPVSFEMPYAENYTLPADEIARRAADEIGWVMGDVDQFTKRLNALRRDAA